MSSPLKNSKWELFAAGVAKGLSATTSYLTAGYECDEESARRLASRLLTNVDVQRRVSEIQQQLTEQSIAVAVLDRETRLLRLEQRAAKMDQVIESRAADRSFADVPGGHTGLLVRTLRAAGKRLVEEFAVDVALLKEVRAHEQQAAIERGEWLTKTAVDLRSSDIPVMDVPSDASIEQIREAKKKLLEAIATFQKPAKPTTVQ
jgi:hypothetical protein